IATIAGVVLGIALGIAMREAHLSQLDITYFAFPGDILLRMLKMMILPLIVCSLITGVANLDQKASGKLGGLAVTYYMTTTLIAVIIGIVLVVTINPENSIRVNIQTYLFTLHHCMVTRNLMFKLFQEFVPRKLSSSVFSTGNYDRIYPTVHNIPPMTRRPWLTYNQTILQLYQTTREPIIAEMNVTSIVPIVTNSSTTIAYELTTIVEQNVTVDYRLVSLVLYWAVLVGSYKLGINVLGIICFCITFGVIIGGMGKEGEILVRFFTAFNEAVMKIVGIVIWYAPIGIIFLIAGEIMKMQDPAKVLEQLGLYMATVIAGLAIHGLIVLPLIYFIVVRKNPFVYLSGVLQIFLNNLFFMTCKIAITLVCVSSMYNMMGVSHLRYHNPPVATSSSSATLPVTVNCLEKNNKVDKRITRFVVPIGATINMDGTALYEAVAAIFIAQANGIVLNFGQIVTVSITATFASIGAAGVPQAGLVTLIIVLTAVGLPVEDITLILAIDWLLDRIRTTVNVLGDSIGAGVIAHICRKDLADKRT
uniref:Amino acid transporter n=1 Tax=Ciona savignyi TaxID=51511 RepID=H2YDN1_CIOSA